MMMMCLMALDNLETVWDMNGWQMATYLSMVKAVIVNTVAFVADSDANPCKMHETSPNI